MLTHVFFDEGQKQRLTWFEDVPNARHRGSGGGEWERLGRSNSMLLGSSLSTVVALSTCIYLPQPFL